MSFRDPKWTPEVLRQFRIMVQQLGFPQYLEKRKGGYAIWQNGRIRINDLLVPDTPPFRSPEIMAKGGFITIDGKKYTRYPFTTKDPQILERFSMFRTEAIPSFTTLLDWWTPQMPNPDTMSILAAIPVEPIREHMVTLSSGDPRWQPGVAAIKYEVESKINTIDRRYGTASQNIRYPRYTDFLKYGVLSVPRWDLPIEVDEPVEPY